MNKTNILILIAVIISTSFVIGFIIYLIVKTSRSSISSVNNNYKIREQNVWPFPNNIVIGGNILKVNKSLTVKSLPKQLRSLLSGVVDDFNEFTFIGDSLPTDRHFYTFVIDHPSPSYQLTKKNFAYVEAYTLAITTTNIKINAHTYIGIIRALTTLCQLIRPTGLHFTVKNVPLKIMNDKPKYFFRSVLLDTARNYLPVSTIKRIIQGMQLDKLNFLHLHLTDAQSFPLDLGPYTHKLSTNVDKNGNTGAFSLSETYTRADISDLVEYAKARGIYIIPEVDTPGHAFSWSIGSEDIMTCYGRCSQDQRACPEPSCGYMNLATNSKNVHTWVQNVWTEVIEAFHIGEKGFSDIIHLGLDEVSVDLGHVCKSGPTSEQYIAYLKWLFGLFKNNGSSGQGPLQNKPQLIKPMLWADPVISFCFPHKNTFSPQVLDLNFIPNAILQFWALDQNSGPAINALSKYAWVMSNSKLYYLDAGGNGSAIKYGGPIITENKLRNKDQPWTRFDVTHNKYWMSVYSPGLDDAGKAIATCANSGGIQTKTGIYRPLRGGCLGGQEPSGGWTISWQEIYLNHPQKIPDTGNGGWADSTLTNSLPDGIEVCCWGESIDYLNLDYKLFPKASAVSEMLWRGPDKIDNILHATRRLAHHREDLIRIGLRPDIVGEATIFRHAPWGSKVKVNDNLMLDINQNSNRATIPAGYFFNYRANPCYPFASCNGYGGINDPCDRTYNKTVNPMCVTEIAKAAKTSSQVDHYYYGVQCGRPVSSANPSYPQPGCPTCTILDPSCGCTVPI